MQQIFQNIFHLIINRKAFVLLLSWIMVNKYFYNQMFLLLFLLTCSVECGDGLQKCECVENFAVHLNGSNLHLVYLIHEICFVWWLLIFSRRRRKLKNNCICGPNVLPAFHVADCIGSSVTPFCHTFILLVDIPMGARLSGCPCI